MTRRFSEVTLAGLCAALLLAGCSTDTELGGVRIPNSRPDTRITGQPPTLLEAGFVVEFNWTGTDADGKIVGYEWKISDNGADGISPRDTMTVDPLTGAIAHPWYFTTSNDSIFFVLADQDSFPKDTTDPRSFRTHTIFVRAVDEKGARDGSPAHMTFTSTTIVPTCRVEFPGIFSSRLAQPVPTTLNIGWSGEDPDYTTGGKVPQKVRWLWVPAVAANGTEVQSETSFELYKDELIDFDDPRWTAWFPYADSPEARRAPQSNFNNGISYLFAVQVQDIAGAVSIGRNYQRQVAHVIANDTRYLPTVTLAEQYLGRAISGRERDEVAAGQPLNFSWRADAAWYNGNILSYQHGWDVADLNNVTDPGWEIGPGLAEQNYYSQERSFNGGLKNFFLKVLDDSGNEVVYRWELTVIPFVPLGEQDPLLVIDQVVDDNTGRWPDASGVARDGEEWRNQYWHFLAENTGVEDFSWETDRLDHTSIPKYSALVNYQVVLCYARLHGDQLMLNQFRPTAQGDKFVWLEPYQARGGNFFLVGDSSLDSFLRIRTNYMLPIVFDTREQTLSAGGTSYIVGFGTKELPDGTEVERGPLMYHYATAGISAIDWTATGSKTIYNRTAMAASQDRFSQCTGIKALTLDPDFKANHLIGPGVVADTIATDIVIDRYDYEDEQAGVLQLTSRGFPFGTDEFVNTNITPRTTPIIPQTCAQGPGGLCIEPMFRGQARFDWLREKRWSEGESRWPFSRYTADDLLEDLCGKLSLARLDTLENSSARTNGRPYGWFSYKMAPDKPSKKADVYWGFDPYRFNADQSRQAIRWVLEYFGLQLK